MRKMLHPLVFLALMVGAPGSTRASGAAPAEPTASPTPVAVAAQPAAASVVPASVEPAPPRASAAPAAPSVETVEKVPPGAASLLASAPGALEKLQARLAALQDHRAPDAEPLRIVQIGDSHTEAGFFSRSLEKLLADGQPLSPGFIWPGMLAPGDVEVVPLGRKRDWKEESWLDPHASGPFGPRGVAFTTVWPGATLELRATAPLPAGTKLTVYYAPLPGHRAAELFNGDRMLARLQPPEEAPASSLGHVEVTWPARATVLRLVADKNTAPAGELRLYGFTVERPGAAISYDALGARGTTSEHPLRRDDGALLEYLRLRAPDVVVVWFGSNSAVARPFNSEGFAQSFTSLLDKLREATPDASLLVVGPPDLERRPDGCGAWAFQKKRRLYPREREALRRFACTPAASVARRPGRPTRYPAEGVRTEEAWQQWLASCSFNTLPTIANITDLERSAALAAGGLFFDTYEFMGAEGSIHSWACGVPQLGEFDHVHLTPAGHARLAEAIRDAIKTGSR